MFASHGWSRGRPLIAAYIVVATGCSSGGDRGAASDSTAGVASGAAPADNAIAGSRAQESSVVAPDTTTTVRTQSGVVAPKPAPKAKVRPSIDPGRKASSNSASATTPASTDSSAVAVPSGSSDQDQNLKYDAKTNTVTFQLIGGPSGFQFNGHASGSATLTLPPKANVVMNFINKDGTPHSAEIISGEGPLPNSGGEAAIPRAYTNQLIQGLPQEGTDDMKFTAPASGSYRIFCGVPGHGLSGMWIWMKIDPAAKAPSFGPTKA
jgi:hypothetical protein